MEVKKYSQAGTERTADAGYVVKSDAAFDLLPALRAVVSDKRFLGRRFADFNFIGDSNG